MFKETQYKSWFKLNIPRERAFKQFKCPRPQCVNVLSLTYLLTQRNRVLLFGKLTNIQLVKKFPVFYGTRMFITAFTSARYLSLSTSSIQSIPSHPTSWRSILILFSHLRLSLPCGLFPSCFPTKTLYTPLFSPIQASCPVRLILIDFITWTVLCEEYRSLSSSYVVFSTPLLPRPS